MDTELYAIVGALCASELLHYAKWGVLAVAGLSGMAIGFALGIWATRWRPPGSKAGR